MADALLSSVSGLLAFQQALDVTSNNIANSSTAGYSVETANISQGYAQGTSTGFIGSGANVTSITRSYSETLAGQVRSSQSAYSYFTTLSTQATNVDNMLSASSTGLTSSLQSFSNALQTLSTDPSQTASGQALLSSAQTLTQQLQDYNTQLQGYSSSLESSITSTIPQVNTLATNIASLNAQIAQDTASTGQAPNSLLDQRDQDITQLSQYVTVTTSTQSNNEMNVYIGNGQALVVGSTSQQLVAIANQYNPTEHDIGITAGGNTTVNVTNEITGGTLGGLIATRTQVLDPTENQLGQIAVGLTSTINALQESGMTQNGTLGTAMFSVGSPQVTSSSFNTGTASVSASVSDSSTLTADDYVLSNNGGTWQLTDNTTGASVAMTGSGTSADPFQADGLSIVVNGSANSGDSYLIQPTTNAISGMSVLLTSPSQIASAGALQTTPTSTNTGSGAISSATVTDNTNTNLLDSVSISFSSATAYTVTDTTTGATLGSGTYTSGQPITGNGWQVSISGSPAAGDSFSVSDNAGNVGDNTNLLAMVSALSSNTLNGGTASLSGSANSLVSQIGVLTQSASNNATAQQNVNTSATDALNNVSGVNLDDEAAKMVAYQQAYQACAQVIQTSNDMFKSLISAIGA